MFYPKKLITKRVSKYKLNFTAFASSMNTEVDEGILPHKYAKLTYNYKISNGALKTGIGFEDLTSMAAVKPAGPAPTMAMSKVLSILFNSYFSSSFVHLSIFIISYSLTSTSRF